MPRAVTQVWPKKSIQTIIGDRETVTVERTMYVSDAARLMAERQIGAVPVLDGERLAGIFSEREVLTRVVAGGCDPDATPVGDVKSSELVVADAAESDETCPSGMQQGDVRHVIVLDQWRLAGIVSLRDLLTVDISEKG